MKLLTKTIESRLPALYATEHTPLEDKIAVAKFFDPCGSYTFYAIEGERQDPDREYMMFGMVTGLDVDELGYCSLSELAAYRGPLGIGIERDTSFRPTRLSSLSA